MRLEGTLDAFSLPDIFQLLSFTKKTGALHLHRDAGGVVQAGVVHVRGGAVAAARSEVSRQQLARRLMSSGLVDDEALAAAAEELADNPAAGLARLLADRADLPADAARAVAADQIADAVFELLRWPDGEFAFVVNDDLVDDLGVAIPVEQLVEEARRRLEAWPAIADQVPAADAVLRLNPVPPAEPATTSEEWSLLALVDGRRSAADLVALDGRGEYAVVSALAALVGRGLLVVGEPGDDPLLRRHRLLSALEGVPVAVQPAEAEAPVPSTPVPAAPAVPAAPGRRGDPAVIPHRSEPFAAPRRPEHPEDVPAFAHVTTEVGPAVTAVPGHGSVNGATAMQPEASLGGLVERDPDVNKSLLLRLIAGVRGL